MVGTDEARAPTISSSLWISSIYAFIIWHQIFLVGPIYILFVIWDNLPNISAFIDIITKFYAVKSDIYEIFGIASIFWFDQKAIFLILLLLTNLEFMWQIAILILYWLGVVIIALRVEHGWRGAA
ncbi:hypothetical protein ACMAY8_04565 [Rhodobacteraceae bacterium nBUS_22]